MRLTLVVTILGFLVVACGSSSGPTATGPTSTGGSRNPVSTGGNTGRGGSQPDSGLDGPPLDTGASLPGTSGRDCTWLADCVSASTCTSQACVDSCGTQASGTAVEQYLALISCISANPQCSTTACLSGICAAEINACSGLSTTVDAGVIVQPIDTAPRTTDAALPPDQPDAASVTREVGGEVSRPDATQADAQDAVVIPPSLDAHLDISLPNGTGYTTSGSCDIVASIPNLLESHTCWDYTLTVTANHNDGTEHYVAYSLTDVSGTQSACTSQSYSASQPGPWDSASISASNLSHKKQACDLAGSGYGATAKWTEGGSCVLAGSLGHCTDKVANQWNPSTQIIDSSLMGTWSVP